MQEAGTTTTLTLFSHGNREEGLGCHWPSNSQETKESCFENVGMLGT